MPPPSTKPHREQQILSVVRRYWGFDSLRPLQTEAIEAALSGRDSLVVMPTGGGKSLCYQVPPALDGATDVIVSPLISLMKDQVDGLQTCGYPAACIHSGLSGQERRTVEAGLAEGKYRLLFVAPERLMAPWFLDLVTALRVKRFSIDEAHCISHWGHDFRPDYRQLAMLRGRFPEACFHAFTATATPRVQADIVAQLALRDPAILVGRFDRPNLIYRILPLVDKLQQTLDVIARHAGEAMIIYCLSRKDTENMTAMLLEHKIRAAAYHAGLSAEERHRTQEAFAEERLDIVVATVAFGMGIDRSNVRCVLHATMPKSVEHYQQETGRAGRDGLEAECVLLYSAADAMRWEGLLRRSAEESHDPEALVAAQMRLVKQIQRLCSSTECRHKALTEYFGQAYDGANCGACDVCLGEVEGMEDSTITAQKILSCVYRTGQRFGVGHVVDVLLGADTENIRRLQHHELSTYGLLKQMPRKELQSFVYQLVDQGLVDRSDGDRPVMALNDDSWAVLRGQREVRLVRPKKKMSARTKEAEISWNGVHRELFDHLRDWRRAMALDRQVPAYVVLTDNTLRDLARVRPITTKSLQTIPGIGQRRLAELGADLIAAISEYCAQHDVPTDVQAGAESAAASGEAAIGSVGSGRVSESRRAAFSMFDQQRTIEEVMSYAGRARSTVVQYLAEYIAAGRCREIDVWVDRPTYAKVAAAATATESTRIKPLHEKLGGAVSYDDIRLVMAHLRASANE
jgi:ATP-dependent DNA helicase RecQ